MASCLPSTLLAITIRMCHHQGGKNLMTTVKNNASLFSVFEMYHEGPSDWPKGSKTSILCWPSNPHSKDTDPYEVQGTVSVGDLVGFQMKYLEFVCEPEDEHALNTGVLIAAESATRKAVDAFQILMAKGHSFPAKKISRYMIIVYLFCYGFLKYVFCFVYLFNRYSLLYQKNTIPVLDLGMFV